ncbi:hypothetical protein QZM87_28520 [Burkholderia gladioli]|nr:hypothetical protein [Burkholderia gladioli]MDN7805690.1 hypothetical protein [Burkholderia gladioli]
MHAILTIRTTTPWLRPLRLQPPSAGLRERLWHSHSSPEGARLAAAHGNGLLLGTAMHDPRGVQLPLA